MANFNEQILSAWNQWELETGAEAGNPDDFVYWAYSNKKLTPRPQDLTKLMRKSVTSALRQALRFDENGISYRAKQCVVLSQSGIQTSFWFDTDTGGTPNLRQKSVRQRREAIANDIYRAKNDAEHMNIVHKENIQFILDFNDDYEERKASDIRDNDEKDCA